jgi:hypothetical protein
MVVFLISSKNISSDAPVHKFSQFQLNFSTDRITSYPTSVYLRLANETLLVTQPVKIHYALMSTPDTIDLQLNTI